MVGRVREHEVEGYVVHHGVYRGGVGQSPREPSRGRPRALELGHCHNPSSPDDALRDPPRRFPVEGPVEDA